MARELAIAGAIALCFGLGSYYATGEAGSFAWVNLAAGALALVAGAILGVRRIRGFGTPAARRVLLPRLALLGAVVLAVGAAERMAAHLGWRLDWTTERVYALSEGTEKLLSELPDPLEITFYRERGDPRAQRTWLMLQNMARRPRVALQERFLDESEDEARRLGISSTEAVVLRLGDLFETVERPTEGAIYEALWQLLHPGRRTIYATFGEGEADLGSLDPRGYSGLATLLDTEGYDVRPLVTATGRDVPDDAGAVLVLGPERAFGARAVDSLRRYLARGGSLVALLEPGVETGLEPLLEEWGFALPDGVVIDPAAGRVQGDAPGINPLTNVYSTHPVTRGLGPRTLSLFLAARPVVPARKPEPGDLLEALVYTSPEAWLAPPTEAVLRGAVPPRPADVRPQRWPLVAAGRYPRGDVETRIVAFGDARFADNEYLRALYNVDLMLNAVHWAVRREADITLRPKILTPNQDPFTPQQSLAMLYGVGLLLPELLLIVGAVVWLRRRGA